MNFFFQSYFSHEGFLSGLAMNKETSSLKPKFKLILKFYGYDVDLLLPDNEKKQDKNTKIPDYGHTTGTAKKGYAKFVNDNNPKFINIRSIEIEFPEL